MARGGEGWLLVFVYGVFQQQSSSSITTKTTYIHASKANKSHRFAIVSDKWIVLNAFASPMIEIQINIIFNFSEQKTCERMMRTRLWTQWQHTPHTHTTITIAPTTKFTQYPQNAEWHKQFVLNLSLLLEN